MSTKEMSRRDFAKVLGTTALGAAIISQFSAGTANAMGGASPALPTPILLDLTNPQYQALAQPGGSVKIPAPKGNAKPIIVTRISETEVAAYSSKCTHLGCEVGIPIQGVATCPCHKATFDAHGKVTHGPAKKDLTPYAATLNGTIIEIKNQQ